MFGQILTMRFLSMFEKNVKHRANDASNNGNPPPLMSHNQILLLCWVGWVHPRRMNATPLVKVAIVKNEHSPSRKWRKSLPDASCGGSLLCQVFCTSLLAVLSWSYSVFCSSSWGQRYEDFGHPSALESLVSRKNSVPPVLIIDYSFSE